MKTGAFFIQSSFLFVGLLIVAISLFSANDHSYRLGDSASRRYFYISSEILPDHVLYPMLMLVDHTALQSTHDSSKRIKIQVNYAYRRLSSASALAARHKPGIALSTLTKSQKYLNQAAQEAIATGTREDKQVVIRAISYHNQQISQITDERVTTNQDVTHLKNEAEALMNQLQSTL